MTSVHTRMRQLVDWSAATRAGLLLWNNRIHPKPDSFCCSPYQSLVLHSFDGIFGIRFESFAGTNQLQSWSHVSWFSGPYDWGSSDFHFLIAIIVHQYGILISLVGGAVMGLSVYGIIFLH